MNDCIEEKWAEYNGYLVSDQGRVKGKYVEFLKLTKVGSGYLMAGARLGSVHRLVWKAFNGEIPEGLEIDHINRVKDDNRLSNLRAVTRSDNQRNNHRLNSNMDVRGSNNPMSTLRESDVIDIYDMIKEGYNNQQIAKKYNLHDRYVSLIRHGKRWSHLYKDHFDKDFIYNSLGNISLSIKQALNLIKLIINTDKTDKEIGDLYGFDRSEINRIRNKKIWKDAWKLYYKNCNDHPEKE